MSQTIKSADQSLTEEMLKSVVGKFVHIPQNLHTHRNEFDDKEEEFNAWFAGQVGGYEKAYISYDYEKDEFYPETKVCFHLLMTDGTGYVLSEDKLEILEITEEEFEQMVKDHQARELILGGMADA